MRPPIVGVILRGTEPDMRLNGWQRIAIVLGTIWIPIGFFWGNSLGIHRGDWAIEAWEECLDRTEQQYAERNSKDLDAAQDKCKGDFMPDYNESIRGHEFYGILMVVAGELCLRLAWLLLWFAWRTFRWVYAGFKSGEKPRGEAQRRVRCFALY